MKLSTTFHKHNEMLNIGENCQIRPLQVGDRVGAGWFKSSCHMCAQCKAGYDNLCPDAVAQMGQQGACGGFADYVRSVKSYAVNFTDWIYSLF